MRDVLSEREPSFALDTIYRFNVTDDTSSFARVSLSLLCSAIPCIQGIFTLIDDVNGMPQSSNSFVWGRRRACSANSRQADTNATAFLPP